MSLVKQPRKKAKARATLRSAPALHICILAGGLSRRMGRDKTKVRLGNETLLNLVRTAAIETGLPVRIIRRDLVPRCGPIGGVHTAFQKCKAAAILFLACDMPFVTSDLILRFICKFESAGKPVFAHAEPAGSPGFPFILPASAASVVREQIRHREFSLRALAQTLRATTPRLPRRLNNLLANINDPQELLAARSLISENDERPSRTR